MTEQVRVDEEEYWPVYELADPDAPYGKPIDVPDGFTERFRRATEEWEACQTIIGDLINPRRRTHEHG